MKELLVVLGVTVVATGVITLVATWIERPLRVLENALTFVSTAIILFAMVYICAEVTMRYGFNSPMPGHLEGAELLLPIIVFFAISYTQARNGHVGMSLVVDALPEHWQRRLNITTLVLSMLICVVLAYFGSKYSYQLWEYDDVTMTPPYWRTWPSAAAIALGYLLVAIRMWLQILYQVNPRRFPDSPRDEVEELHVFD